MELKFRITFKRSTKVVAIVEGEHAIDAKSLTVGEVVEGVHQTEAFLEKITGLRVHIEQVN